MHKADARWALGTSARIRNRRNTLREYRVNASLYRYIYTSTLNGLADILYNQVKASRFNGRRIAVNHAELSRAEPRIRARKIPRDSEGFRETRPIERESNGTGEVNVIAILPI